MTVLETGGLVLFLLADAGVGYLYFRWMRGRKAG